MSGTIQTVVTNQALRYWAQMFGGFNDFDRSFFRPVSFKIGEGGWVSVGGGGRAPRKPDPNLTDLDCVLDPDRIAGQRRYPVDSRASFTKNFTQNDLFYVAPNIVRCRCFLDLQEFNSDGAGGNPELWEIGIFGPTVDSSPFLIAYGTFPMVTKRSNRQSESLVDIAFSR